MQKDLQKSINYHLEPGYVYVSGKGAVIRTIVGSCVSVTLWDNKKHAGGMNHFVHPRTRDHDKRTTSFGNVALPVLVKMMEQEFGCKREDLHAQIIGGASPMELSCSSAGQENITIARRFLEKVHIRVVSEDVGGNMGRKILFDTATGQVAVLKVQQLRKEDWINVLN